MFVFMYALFVSLFLLLTSSVPTPFAPFLFLDATALMRV
jgi:hypothetical protein